MTTERLKIADIKRDPLTQCRVQLSQDAIDDMADHLKSGGELPPIEVFRDDTGTWTGDGYHRLAAHIAVGRKTIDAIVYAGGQEEAFINNCKANGQPRGLPMTRADKQKAVGMALDRWQGTKSTREIAELIGVSHTFVSNAANARTKPEAPRKAKAETVNVYSAPEPKPRSEPKNEVSDEPAEEFLQIIEDDGDHEVETMVAPEVASLTTPNATIEKLDAIRSALGKIIRQIDDADANRRYSAKADAVRGHLGKALESLLAWRKGV